MLDKLRMSLVSLFTFLMPTFYLMPVPHVLGYNQTKCQMTGVLMCGDGSPTPITVTKAPLLSTTSPLYPLVIISLSLILVFFIYNIIMFYINNRKVKYSIFFWLLAITTVFYSIPFFVVIPA